MARSGHKAKIGIFGGTFDPVHIGHLRTILDVLENLKLDQIRLLPCAEPPHRQKPVATAAERCTMLELAITNHPKLVVDDRELTRDGPSYSVDTLLSLREEYVDNPLFLLMGTDTFLTLPSWMCWQQLFELTHIVVMQRPGDAMDLDGEMALIYRDRQADKEDMLLPAGKVWTVPVTQLAISSTAIRDSIGQQRDVRYLLPDAVIALIEQRELYQPKKEADG